MSSLYSLTEEFVHVFNMLYDPGIDIQVILDTLEGTEYEFEEKAVGYAKLIKSMLADVDMIKKEEVRLSIRRKQLEERASLLKDNLENAMRTTGKTRFKTPLFSFNIQKNGGKEALILDVETKNLPVKYRIKQEPLPNGEAIRNYLKKNNIDACEWAHLEPQSESLRIR